MTILYVILTCAAHKETRQKWQRESWLQGVDYVYLDKPVGEETYKNAPLKYVEFLRDTDLSKYDWVFFCDDDTFVFTGRLQLPETNKPCMVGHKSGSFRIYSVNIHWCSGGAGFALNKALIQNVQNLLKTTTYIVTDETDISLAVWCRFSSPDVYVLHNPLFHPYKPVPEEINSAVTFHYCDENDFNYLKQFI